MEPPHGQWFAKGRTDARATQPSSPGMTRAPLHLTLTRRVSVEPGDVFLLTSGRMITILYIRKSRAERPDTDGMLNLYHSVLSSRGLGGDDHDDERAHHHFGASSLGLLGLPERRRNQEP